MTSISLSFFCLIFLHQVVSKDMLVQEVEKTESLISLLTLKIDSLKLLKSSLESSNTKIPEGQSWLSWLEAPSSLPSRFHLISTSTNEKFISDSDFLLFRHSSTPGFISCQNDGLISIFNEKGDQLKQFYTESELLYCASSQGGDEILIGSTDKTTLKVFRLTFNQTENFPVRLILDQKVLDQESGAEITAFTQYTRLGKKFWVVGDSFGNITVVASDGEVFGSTYGKVGMVEQIVKQGQQLMFAGKRRIAIFNVGTMEVTGTCGDTIADIFKFTIDQPSAVLHVSLVNGDVLTFDSRFSISNGPAFCKAVHRNTARFAGNLASIKGGLLSWAGSGLIFFNTSYLEVDSISKPEYYTVPTRYSRSIKSAQVTEGNLLMLSGINEIRIYLIKEPDFIPVSTAGSSFDFGYIRVIAIIIIVIGFVLWKSKNRKSRKDLEVEKLEKSLEELQRSMESTTKMSEDLTSRFKNVEDSTKSLSGLRGKLEDDSD